MDVREKAQAMLLLTGGYDNWVDAVIKELSQEYLYKWYYNLLENLSKRYFCEKFEEDLCMLAQQYCLIPDGGISDRIEKMNLELFPDSSHKRSNTKLNISSQQWVIRRLCFLVTREENKLDNILALFKVSKSTLGEFTLVTEFMKIDT